MSEFLLSLKPYLDVHVIVILAAMLPIIELRGAIPFGIALGLNPLSATVLSILGSTIPVPFIFFGARPVINYLMKTKLFKNRAGRIIDRTIRKSGGVKKYGFWGLLIFVGIPLPGTGAWTGTLAGDLLGMRFKRVFSAVLLGNILAGIIVYLISYAAISSLRFF